MYIALIADLVGDNVGDCPDTCPIYGYLDIAVIADLVGDNVGDCAARGADLFESIAAEIIRSLLPKYWVSFEEGVQGLGFSV